jgi:uncharacterized membrane protein YhaH (DUF805 family)
MNWGHVLFSPNGRISKSHYWYGVLVIILANLFSNFIPILGTLISLGLIWVGIAVYGKRLHDTGRSAWLHAVPWALSIALVIAGFVMIGGTLLELGLNDRLEDPDTEEIFAILAASGGFLLMMLLSTLVWIVYTLWLGFSAGDTEANAYGPVPGLTKTAEPTSEAVKSAPSESE